ncbi:chloride channel protein [Corynebacterium comes]|uniref:H(+)/Cl(-) exchange transporter ClcA n=1 Tax=Corynebacterium comes TaxID=2675218 RepID=A0A6B8VWY6_9CORY|nr:chloride channel protein [Corynebacterium comes]QGU04237.1 H(+)/Cl(-) exchange transporter ClcA [Corynebacterium comes]
MFRGQLVLIPLVLAGGVAAGVIGGAMAWLIHRIQLSAGGVGVVHPVAAAAIGGLLAGLGWWWLRRQCPVRSIEDSILTDDAPLPLGRTSADALLQLLVVGSGLSLGREQAPRQASAAVLDQLTRLVRVREEHRRILVAAAAGAGLAAVYNVPVAGILFTLEALPVRRDWRALLIAGVMSAVATVTAWPIVGRDPVYEFPDAAFSAPVLYMLPLLLLGAALIGRLFRALLTSTEGWKVIDPRWLPVSVGVTTAGVVAVSFLVPGVTGNGEQIVRTALDPASPLALLAVLVVAKPLLTAVSLGSGAVGGTLTPSLAVGAAMGGLLGLVVGVDPGLVAVFALIGAAGVLAVMQQTPVFAAVIAWELTWAPLWTLPLLFVVATGAYFLGQARDQGTSDAAGGHTVP